MRFSLLFFIPFVVMGTNVTAAEERELICHSGPGMYAKYRQTRNNQNITVFFKRQKVSHARKKVTAGYCAFPLGGISKDLPDRLFMTKKNPRNTLMALHISPTTVNIDFQAMNKGTGVTPQIKAMIDMIQRHRRYIIRAKVENVGGIIGKAWVVKSIGWNNTL